MLAAGLVISFGTAHEARALEPGDLVVADELDGVEPRRAARWLRSLLLLLAPSCSFDLHGLDTCSGLGGGLLPLRSLARSDLAHQRFKGLDETEGKGSLVLEQPLRTIETSAHGSIRRGKPVSQWRAGQLRNNAGDRLAHAADRRQLSILEACQFIFRSRLGGLTGSRGVRHGGSTPSLDGRRKGRATSRDSVSARYRRTGGFPHMGKSRHYAPVGPGAHLADRAREHRRRGGRERRS